MSADAKKMEALLRIEHKLDILLNNIRIGDEKFAPVGDSKHTCGICREIVTYGVLIDEAMVVRKCKCWTGKIALDLKSFAPPINPIRENNNGRDEQEDGGNPIGRGNRKGR